jgi:hypothetical protein
MPTPPPGSPHLDLLPSDSPASQDALARYETLRPILQGHRTLIQQSHRQASRISVSGVSCSGFGVMAPLVCWINARFRIAVGRRRLPPTCLSRSSSRSSAWRSRIPSRRVHSPGLSRSVMRFPLIIAASSGFLPSIASPPRSYSCITRRSGRPPYRLVLRASSSPWHSSRRPTRNAWPRP